MPLKIKSRLLPSPLEKCIYAYLQVHAHARARAHTHTHTHTHTLLLRMLVG